MASEYVWYLEPLDSSTNEVISRVLAEDDFVGEFATDRGKRQLWQCPIALIPVFVDSQESLKLKFRVYNRKNSGGRVRDVTFLFKGRGKAQARELQKLAETLSSLAPR